MLLVEHIKAINNVTSKDYAEIVSTFMTLTHPMYRCFDCKRKYKTDPVKTAKLLESKACNYIADKPRHKYTADFNNKGNPTILYSNCIGNHYKGKWSGIINFHTNYQKGIMPFDGGMMDQPSKFVEIMQLVYNLIIENEQEAQRKEQLHSRNRPSGK